MNIGEELYNYDKMLIDIRTTGEELEYITKSRAIRNRTTHEIEWHGISSGTMMGVPCNLERVETPRLPDGRVFCAMGGEITMAKGPYAEPVGTYTRLIKTQNIGPQKIKVYLDETNR